jgi:16S rRNA methyltransferase RsmB/F
MTVVLVCSLWNHCKWQRDACTGLQVQDEAAGLVVALLDPQPGEAILDACAAPGGKTLFAAARMGQVGLRPLGFACPLPPCLPQSSATCPPSDAAVRCVRSTRLTKVWWLS